MPYLETSGLSLCSEAHVFHYPKSLNGRDPSDYKEAKKLGETPPNDLDGCSLALAHELVMLFTIIKSPTMFQKLKM